MRYLADLHIHSRYSRATSRACELPGLAAWAGLKGIHLIGTGDFTHPGWFAHLEAHLLPAEPGFFQLRPDDYQALSDLLPPGAPLHDPTQIRFILTAEISSIYKRHDRVRKVHNLLVVPDFESVRRINATLSGIGNLTADGRPILGLDSRDLLEILLEQAAEGFLVPAHIWTPWFSIFGSKSGFDTVEECFGDLSDHIFALETGLSSDPDMNRLISGLDRYTLISNSDCHSPAKLGREVNIFNTGFDYFSMRAALQAPCDAAGHQVFEGTVEFYPEEGKYHADGHRKCGICFEPGETEQYQGKCPVCGRSLTVGVLNRVMALADREKPYYPPGSPAVHSLVPLPEILSEMVGVGPNSKRVQQLYGQLLHRFTSEFNLLLHASLDEITTKGSVCLAEAIRRVRTGEVIRQPGYDGEFGVIRLFKEGEREQFGGQGILFGVKAAAPRVKKRERLTSKAVESATTPAKATVKPAVVAKKLGLNEAQQIAVDSMATHLVVQAGPGTGKTHTLVSRVVKQAKSQPGPYTVITFTNKAAEAVATRLSTAAVASDQVWVGTLHRYCLDWLRTRFPGLAVVGPESRQRLLQALFPEWRPKVLAEQMSGLITGLQQSKPGNGMPVVDKAVLTTYLAHLESLNLVDIDGVVSKMVTCLQEDQDWAIAVRAKTGGLFIDEFQDLNAGQYALITALASSCSVFAIGDPDQAIYGFRGADPTFFQCFKKEFQAETHRLRRNYRSGRQILRAAEAVIQVATDRPSQPALINDRQKTGQVSCHQSQHPADEAHFIASQVVHLLGQTSNLAIQQLGTTEAGHYSLADFCVLYRTGRQAAAIGKALAQQGLPFQVVDIVPFYRTGLLRPLYLWLQVASNLAEGAECLVLLSLEPGIGAKGRQALETLLPIGPPTMTGESGWFEWLQAAIVQGQLSGRLATCLTHFITRFQAFKTDQESVGLKTALLQLCPHYQLDSSRPEVSEFFQLAAPFLQDLQGLARHLRRYSDTVVYDERAESVKLMTIHAAKGLEFPVVFVAGLEEGILPLQPRGVSDPVEMTAHYAEERRLFYVAVTRAMDLLFLSHCQCHWGMTGEGAATVSRFLEDLPASLKKEPTKIGQYPSAKKPLAKKKKSSQLSLF